jgi:hypothetical protein
MKDKKYFAAMYKCCHGYRCRKNNSSLKKCSREAVVKTAIAVLNSAPRQLSETAKTVIFSLRLFLIFISFLG